MKAKFIGRATIGFSTLLLCFSLCENIIQSKAANARDLKNTENIINPSYRVGPGDRLAIKVFQMENFSQDVNILPDGTINLPRIGSIYINRLTLNELNQLITKEYKRILKRPIIYINLIQTRPLRIIVSGEVNRPGIYSLDLVNKSKFQNNSGDETYNLTSKGWPTIIEAIQKAGGLTSRADLRKINLKRKDKHSKDINIKINLWEPLKNGSSITNHYIFDGDRLLIEKSLKINENELQTISRSNFTPSTILVNVIGEVVKPGIQSLRPNIPLTEALLSAGGITSKANKTGIKHIRLKQDGSIETTVIKYNSTFKINNKILQDRDIILVPKNKLAKTSETLKNYLEPVRPMLDSISIYKMFSN